MFSNTVYNKTPEGDHPVRKADYVTKTYRESFISVILIFLKSCMKKLYTLVSIKRRKGC